ncbi:MAG TPA: TadE/TadG family type IV pilus assembly protein [Candidatus Sulfotelmatobacter sp.]|jgi:Flp pilus assembly protein TadG|nr:TadE/TadG family type IV pilus assembly protein [Candidatus Sulfotelmatobacter sp.]
MIAAFRRRRAGASFKRSRSGTTAVEFALILPILVMLTAGVMELGLILLTDASLEIGIRAASRFGTSGMTQTGLTRVESIEQTVESFVSRWLPAGTKVAVTTTVYGSLSDIPEPYTDLNGNGTWDQGEPFTDLNGNGVWDGGSGSSSAGGSGDIVVYHVSFSRPGFTGVLNLAGISTLNFSRQIVVQNE